MFYSASSKTYPEDIQCVLEPSGDKGGIFISNVEAAQNINTLKRHKIQAILTAAFNINLNHNKNDIPYFKHVPGKDHEKFDLSIYFDDSVQFIDKALEKTNILVHCMAGVSRSVTLVLAFLIKKKGMTYDEAYSMVKQKRRIIHPNDGFIRQLRDYEFQCKKGNVTASKMMSYSRVQMKRSAFYDSPLKKYESTTLYSSPLKRYYESPSKARYQSPMKKYEPSPLNNHNKYINPQRASMRGLSGLKYVDYDFMKQKEHYLDTQIADIKKKYSQPEDFSRFRHTKSKSIIENIDRPSISRNFESTSTRGTLDMFGMRKLSSMYDHLKF